MNIELRPMLSIHHQVVRDLVRSSFEEFIAADFTEQGRQAFREITRTAEISESERKGHDYLLAFADDTLAGVVRFRLQGHIHWLFVDGRFHRRGIARRLLQAASQRIRRGDPELTHVTLNAAPSALPVYQRLGFVVCGPEHEENGMRSTPMIMPLGGS